MGDKLIAIGASLLLHALAFALLAVTFSSTPRPLYLSAEPAEVAEAVAVDEERVAAELSRLRSDEQARRDAEAARQRRLADEADQMRRAKEEEARRLTEIKQKREQELREAEAERQRLAELKAEQEKVRIEKTALEKERAEEQAKLALAEKKREREQAKLAETEKKRKATEEARKKEDRERELRKKMEEEERRLVTERRRQKSRLNDRYMGEIQEKVRANWLRPVGTPEEFECEVLVHQLASGDVVEARITKSCGNAALDRSVEAAVQKASPLPPPPDPELFDREIKFKFIPRSM